MSTVFPFKPDLPILEALEWKTDIIETHKGNEQRIKIRKHPRHIIEWKVDLLDPTDFLRAKALLFGSNTQEFVIPMWQEAFYSDTNYLSGESVLDLSGEMDYVYFNKRGYVCFYEDEYIHEYQEINDVYSGEVHLKSGIDRDYTDPFFIMPAKKANLLSEIPYEVHTDEGHKFSLVWTVRFNREIESHQMETSYKNKEVLLDIYDVSGSALSENIARSLNTIDYGTGSFTVFSRMDYARQKIGEIGFHLKGREVIHRFRSWLHNICGKWKSFWLPNYQFVLEPVSSITSTFFIKNIGYTYYLFSNPLFKHLLFYKYDGSVEIREVTDCVVTDDATEEMLYLDSAVSGDDYRFICFLGLYRLDTDRIELNWEQMDEVQTKFPVIGVEA